LEQQTQQVFAQAFASPPDALEVLQAAQHALDGTPEGFEQAGHLLHGYAQTEQAEHAPWVSWLEETRNTDLDLGLCLIQAAERAAGAQLVDQLGGVDQRDTYDDIRLKLYEWYWREDPRVLGFNRARKLLFKETPRANSELKAELIRQVISHSRHPRAFDLLVEAAGAPALPERARREAIRGLRRFGDPNAVPYLDGLFHTETRNALLRKEALTVLIELDPKRGAAIAREPLPNQTTEPVIHAFLLEIRAQLGIPKNLP